MEIQSARLHDLFLGMKNELIDYYSREELRPMIHIILEHVTGFNRTQMVLNKDKELSEWTQDSIQQYLEEIKAYLEVTNGQPFVDFLESLFD